MTVKIIPEIKQRLAMSLPGKSAQLQMAPSFRPDILSKSISAQAGVMVLLYPNPTKLYLALTKRTEYPGVHGGQISLPGGKFENGDQNLIETALRETMEEIGIQPSFIEILGQLTPLYIPVSEFEVHPVIGFMHSSPIFTIDKNEVQYIIEVELEFLLSPEAKATKPFANEKYQGNIPYFNINGNEVWGATAMILNEFLEIIKDLKLNF
jgi:8-oxo-dGTP pyrophosphatase MutT (NUDIX family)